MDTYQTSNNQNKFKTISVLTGLAVIVLAIAIYSFAYYGMGNTQGLDRDSQREKDVQTIWTEVRNYKNEKGILPINLESIDYFRGFMPKDPKSGSLYEYHLLDTDSYEICANFETDTYDTSGRFASNAVSNASSDPWSHAPLRTCYQFSINSDKPTKTAEQIKADDKKRMFRAIFQEISKWL